MKKLLLGLMLLTSMPTFAVDFATCTIFNAGEEPQIRKVDFTSMAYDRLGFKIATLIEINNFDYTLQVDNESDDLTLNIGVPRADGIIRSVFLASGKTISIYHAENSINISCN